MTGFWIAGFVLAMLASGLPWAGVWGTAFKTVRTELGLVHGPQDWKIGASGGHHDHGHHDHGGHGGHAAMPDHRPSLPEGGPTLSYFVIQAELERMAFPVLVLPPGAPQRFAPPLGDEWKVASEAQNRPQVRSISYNPANGVETGRSDFADKHPIDRAVNYGIAWHEGQLFGLPNQLMGLAIALALIALSILARRCGSSANPRGRWARRRPSRPADGPCWRRGLSRWRCCCRCSACRWRWCCWLTVRCCASPGDSVRRGAMILRPASPADIPALAELARDAFVAKFGHLYRAGDLAAFLAEHRSEEAYREQLADPAVRIRLAEQDGALTAYCLLVLERGFAERPQPQPQRPVTLSQLYCAPDALGRGAGTALMGWALEEARRHGGDAMQLSVYFENHAAQRFYTRFGFRKVGDTTYRVGEHLDPEFLFELVL